VHKFVTDVMVKFAKSNKILRRVEDIAKNAASKGCMDELQKTAKIVNETLPSLTSGRALHPANFQDAVNNLTSPISKAFLIKVAPKVIATALSQFMDDMSVQLIEPSMRLGSPLVSDAATLGSHIVNGLCGLVPEAGGAMCAVLTNAMATTSSIVSAHVIPAGVAEIKQNIHIAMLESLGPYIVQLTQTGRIDSPSRGASKVLATFLETAMPSIQAEMTQCEIHRKSLGVAVAALADVENNAKRSAKV